MSGYKRGIREPSSATVDTRHGKRKRCHMTEVDGAVHKVTPKTLIDDRSKLISTGSSLRDGGNRTSEVLHCVGQHEQSLMADPIYRIMRSVPRSDVLEIRRCKLGIEECERAVYYFDSYFMKNPLRCLRLQIGCCRSSGFQLFYPKLHHHRLTLRFLDLSRNDLDEDDVATLIQLLGMDGADSSECSSPLEVVDLSYNHRIGNHGALVLLETLRHSARIRAVVLKCISVDDSGAVGIASLLQQWPKSSALEQNIELSAFQMPNSGSRTGFFLCLNENRIGAGGTVALGKGIPEHVSLTACKQYPVVRKKHRAM
ncbi:hypothetical protein TRVL_01041 [Trypanosoma vivax]|uniref:Uncharacterized protein n=1 Tax=Trypanosoma vivax (strain Y486) TaxID=1055687 RepID=G0TU92_TRYVY|nr:hypothetical protein TRVL_01041 [Trypanosoma vivax]CCC47526.1 conserved hypothetical protein [Trypanosoma vivax Y486]